MEYCIVISMRTTTARRSLMVNLDPDSASPAPVLKAVVRANQNNAGVYGAVTRIGSTGGRTNHTPPCGDREKGTWVIETQCPGTPPNVN